MQRQSNGGSLSAFARERIFGRKSFNNSAGSRSIHPDKVAMAQALALLGKSRMSESFNALAESARIGALPVHEETEKAINEACKQVAYIKSLLMAALGIKEH
nr:hypothetical protein GCM10011355_30220 [Aquisalinus luteolus]